MLFHYFRIVVSILFLTGAFFVSISHAIEKRHFPSDIQELIVPESHFRVNDVPYILPEDRALLKPRKFGTTPSINYKDEANDIELRQWLVKFQLGKASFYEQTATVNARIVKGLASINRPKEQILYLNQKLAKENEKHREPRIARDIQLLIGSYVLKAQYQIVREGITKSVAVMDANAPRSFMDLFVTRPKVVSVDIQTKLDLVDNQIANSAWTKTLNPFEKARMTAIINSLHGSSNERLAYLVNERNLEHSENARAFLNMEILKLEKKMLSKQVKLSAKG